MLIYGSSIPYFSKCINYLQCLSLQKVVVIADYLRILFDYIIATSYCNN